MRRWQQVLDSSTWMTDNGHKLKQESFRADIKKNSSLCEAEKQVSRDAEQSPSFELFMT